jgi:hypothetical protein
MTIFGLVGFYGSSKFNDVLKKSYPSQWQQLGGPPPLSAKSIGQELRWANFIFFRKYRKLRDGRLSMYGDLVHYCGIANIVILIAWAFIPHGRGPWSG